MKINSQKIRDEIEKKFSSTSDFLFKLRLETNTEINLGGFYTTLRKNRISKKNLMNIIKFLNLNINDVIL